MTPAVNQVPAVTGDDDSGELLPLLADLARLTGANCPACARVLCGHHVLFSIALGFKDAPHCLPCLARQMGRDAGELRDHLARYVRHRDCYSRAWEEASRAEGVAERGPPQCLWDTPGRHAAAPQPRSPASRLAVDNSDPIPVTDTWNAGDMACGDLVLALRLRLNQLPAGGVLRLTARDPAAPEDLPAWCRLTGHRLRHAEHPEYLIERKRA